MGATVRAGGTVGGGPLGEPGSAVIGSIRYHHTTGVEAVSHVHPSNSESMQDAQVRVELLSHPTFISGVRELVSSICRRIGFPELCCGQMALAVDEALCNVMKHGYEGREDQPISVGMQVHEDKGGNDHSSIRIVIEDRAKQVDPKSICGRDLQDVRPGGLGVHMIREIMDDAIYEKREGGGMRLIMSKKNPSQGASCRLPDAGGGQSHG